MFVSPLGTTPDGNWRKGRSQPSDVIILLRGPTYVPIHEEDPALH